MDINGQLKTDNYKLKEIKAASQAGSLCYNTGLVVDRMMEKCRILMVDAEGRSGVEDGSMVERPETIKYIRSFSCVSYCPEEPTGQVR